MKPNQAEPQAKAATLRSYDYATDSESGTVQARTLQAAYDSLRAKIADEQVRDGATLSVAERDGGDRITMDREGGAECEGRVS